MHRLTIIFFSILLISSLNACSTNNKTGVVYQTRFDFSQVQFYSFYNANAEFNADLTMTNFMRNNLELSIEKAMNAQNFIYSELENADIIVSFYVVKKDNHKRVKAKGKGQGKKQGKGQGKGQGKKQGKGKGKMEGNEAGKKTGNGAGKKIENNAVKSSFSQYNKAVRYCEHCLKTSGWQSSEYKWKIKPGSLIVDLIDSQTKRSVWRSVYPLNIEVKENSRQVTDKIELAIQSMISQYPQH